MSSEIPWPYASALSTAQICVLGPTSDLTSARLCSNAGCEISNHAWEFCEVTSIGRAEVAELVDDVVRQTHINARRNVAVNASCQPRDMPARRHDRRSRQRVFEPR